MTYWGNLMFSNRNPGRLFGLNRSPIGILAICFLGLSGCMVKNIPVENIVMFNKKGHLVDPTDNTMGLKAPGLPYAEIKKPPHYYDNIIKALRQHPRSSNGKRKVLFYIHGGLNSQKKTIDRAKTLSPDIRNDGYYPIFINWQSSLISSYMDHLLFVRQGRDWGWWLSPLAPFYLGADVARGVVRAPIVSLYQIANDIRTWPLLKPYRHEMCLAKEMIRDYKDSLKGEAPFDAVPISIEKDERSLWDSAKAGLSYLGTFPIKWVVSPIAIDTFGTNAWELMNRNAHMLYHSEEEFFENLSRDEHSGGLYQFLKVFQAEIQTNPSEWEVSIIGHSMGAIVMNEMIRNFDFNYSSIVYMAGATSIRDYEETIFPYLKTHEHSQVYHLTLHPIAELRDRWGDQYFWVDPPMRGSLLVGRFSGTDISPRNAHHGKDSQRILLRCGRACARVDSSTPTHWYRTYRQQWATPPT